MKFRTIFFAAVAANAVQAGYWPLWNKREVDGYVTTIPEISEYITTVETACTSLATITLPPETIHTYCPTTIIKYEPCTKPPTYEPAHPDPSSYKPAPYEPGTYEPVSKKRQIYDDDETCPDSTCELPDPEEPTCEEPSCDPHVPQCPKESTEEKPCDYITTSTSISTSIFQCTTTITSSITIERETTITDTETLTATRTVPITTTQLVSVPTTVRVPTTFVTTLTRDGSVIISTIITTLTETQEILVDVPTTVVETQRVAVPTTILSTIIEDGEVVTIEAEVPVPTTIVETDTITQPASTVTLPPVTLLSTVTISGSVITSTIIEPPITTTLIPPPITTTLVPPPPPPPTPASPPAIPEPPACFVSGPTPTPDQAGCDGRDCAITFEEGAYVHWQADSSLPPLETEVVFIDASARQTCTTTVCNTKVFNEYYSTSLTSCNFPPCPSNTIDANCNIVVGPFQLPYGGTTSIVQIGKTGWNINIGPTSTASDIGLCGPVESVCVPSATSSAFASLVYTGSVSSETVFNTAAGSSVVNYLLPQLPEYFPAGDVFGECTTVTLAIPTITAEGGMLRARQLPSINTVGVDKLETWVQKRDFSAGFNPRQERQVGQVATVTSVSVSTATPDPPPSTPEPPPPPPASPSVPEPPTPPPAPTSDDVEPPVSPTTSETPVIESPPTVLTPSETAAAPAPSPTVPPPPQTTTPLSTVVGPPTEADGTVTITETVYFSVGEGTTIPVTTSQADSTAPVTTYDGAAVKESPLCGWIEYAAMLPIAVGVLV